MQTHCPLPVFMLFLWQLIGRHTMAGERTPQDEPLLTIESSGNNCVFLAFVNELGLETQSADLRMKCGRCGLNAAMTALETDELMLSTEVGVSAETGPCPRDE
jgi:hypothetical protein